MHKIELSDDLKTFSCSRSASFRVEITPAEWQQLPAPPPLPPRLSAPADSASMYASKNTKWQRKPFTARRTETGSVDNHTRSEKTAGKPGRNTHKKHRGGKMSPVLQEQVWAESTPTIHSERACCPPRDANTGDDL